MTALMYQPAGFRRAPGLQRAPGLRRAQALPFQRRGFGQTAADFAAIAANLTPGSADYQFFSGCAQNPTAPSCIRDFAAQAAQPVLTAQQQASVVQAQQQGATPPTIIGTAPASWIPPVAPAVAQPAAPTPTLASTPAATVQPVQMVQPANAPQPVGTAQPAPVGFLSTTLLGIPLWIWGAAAVGGYFVFSQPGGYRGR